MAFVNEYCAIVNERNEKFYLTMHSTHFIYSYMTSGAVVKKPCVAYPDFWHDSAHAVGMVVLEQVRKVGDHTDTLHVLARTTAMNKGKK